MRAARPSALSGGLSRSAGLIAGQQPPSMPPLRAPTGARLLFMSRPSGVWQTLILITSICGLDTPRKLHRVGPPGGGPAVAAAEGSPAAAAAGDGITGTGCSALKSCAFRLGVRPARAASPPQKNFHFFIAQGPFLFCLGWGSWPAEK